MTVTGTTIADIAASRFYENPARIGATFLIPHTPIIPEKAIMYYEAVQSVALNITITMCSRSSYGMDGLAGLAAAMVITAAKDGAAAAAITPSITDRGGGQYEIALTAAHTDTLGELYLTFAHGDAITERVRIRVRAADATAASQTTIASNQSTLATAVAAVQADTDDIQTRLPAALVGGRMSSYVGAADATVVPTPATIATLQAAVDAIRAGLILRENTAQAGSAATTLVLDAGASAVDDFYNGLIACITSGTGAGQAGTVTDYTGATRTCTIDIAWATTPDNTSVFKLIAGAGKILNYIAGEATATFNDVVTLLNALIIRSGTAQAGSGLNTLKLDAGASAVDDKYKGCLVTTTGGTGAGQARVITAYAGATKQATIDTFWTTTPDNTTTFAIVSFGGTKIDAAGATTAGEVWQTPPTDYAGSTDTMGEAILLLLGLSNGYIVVDSTTNTADGLTAARIRVFSNDADVAAATDGGSGEGEIAVFTSTTSYDSPGKLNVFKSRRTA
jgi:hypothetical protein